MGDLVCLEQWKKLKEEEEVREIQEDIAHLHEQLKYMISEMESPEGPYIYEQEWLDTLPHLLTVSSALDGYCSYEYVYEDKDGEKE